MYYIGHTKDGKRYINDENTQSLNDHLMNVSKYTEKNAKSFQAAEVGKLLGLLHDFGKYQDDFQARVRGLNLKVDHSTQGAITLIEKYGEIGRLYGMIISGHHTGLKDTGAYNSLSDDSYSSKINNFKGQKINYRDFMNLPDSINHKRIDANNETKSFAFATYIKMLFSSLVDADWTDTEEYVNDVKRNCIEYDLENLYDLLKKNIPNNDGSILNNIREEILLRCINEAKNDQGLYTLTVPTGGGKTISSLAFALEHAIKHKLKRIIYVIPYTSIIEQNAKVISTILGRQYVLEHHSNYENSRIDDQDTSFDEIEINWRLKWASENWDMPIILTTNVQFFESFFSNIPSRVRKLHNISESVVIFDEAQMLPRDLLSPSMYAISELIKNYKVTAVLCSATQPAISKYKYQSINIKEIINDPKGLYMKLKRVKYNFVGAKNDNEIMELLKENDKALCIVNTRRHAHAIYELVCNYEDYSVYHLSTLMYPKHRREVINKIKEKLKTDKKLIVISTSLIEAGVDIDFPVVFKSIAGIDSIIQAGGRANREGKLKSGKVFVFESNSENGKTPSSIEPLVSITKEVISTLKEDAFELVGIQKYFEILYNGTSRSSTVDLKNILQEFKLEKDVFTFNFETVANKYKIINENTVSIIVNDTDRSNEIIKKLRKNEVNMELIRELQQFSISIYEHEFNMLKNDNALEMLENGFSVLINKRYYSNMFGLDLFTQDNKNGECSLI
jgi:CRISPR-associated endonuclease/helicase Cas3